MSASDIRLEIYFRNQIVGYVTRFWHESDTDGMFRVVVHEMLQPCGYELLKQMAGTDWVLVLGHPGFGPAFRVLSITATSAKLRRTPWNPVSWQSTRGQPRRLRATDETGD